MRNYFARFYVTAALILMFAGNLSARSSPYRSSSSSSLSVWWFFGGGALLFVVIFALVKYLDRRRAEAMQAVATRLGLTYRWKPTDADNQLIVGCGIAGVGHSHRTAHVLETAPSEDLRMALFDHSYTVGSGKSSQNHKQTVTRIQSPLLNLPSFAMFPETFASKIGKFFGGADINFPEAPEFSNAYILRGPDEGAIRSFFTPALLQSLARIKLHPLPTIDGAGDMLFFHRPAAVARPEQIEAYLTEGKHILAAFVEAQYSRSAAAPPPLPV